jgi:hypothetical protein
MIVDFAKSGIKIGRGSRIVSPKILLFALPAVFLSRLQAMNASFQ